MHEALKFFVIATLIITLWTAFLLLQDKRGTKVLNRWFAVFLMALTLPQLDLYLNQILQVGFFKLAVVASTFLWLKGPFMLAFIQVLTRKDADAPPIALHFLPWLCALVAQLSFPQTGALLIPLGICHMLGYLLFCLWRLVKMRAYLGDVWHGFQNSAYYWLLYLIAGMMALVTVDLVVIALVTSGALASYQVLDYYAFPLFSVYALSVGILSVYRPELLFRDTQDDLPTQIEAQTPSPLSADQPEQKERHLELDASLAQALTQQLTQLMQEKALFLNNELSLANLATHLGISVNQVSELLNVHMGFSFYEYVNSYRLVYASVLLANPKCHLRILDIAFEAGYNNKNSFYRAFKDKFGVTPNQYRTNALSTERPLPAVPVEN